MKRTCLKCGEAFLSKWIGNRICKPCRPLVSSAAAIAENSVEASAMVPRRGAID